MNGPALVIVVVIALIALSIMPILNLVSHDMSLSDAMTVLTQHGYTVFADPAGDLTLTGTLTTQNVKPDGHNTRSWGTSGLYYSSGYVTSLYSTTLNAPTGRTATYVIADANSSAVSKANANAVVTGAADDEIQAGISYCNSTGGGSIYLCETSGQYSVDDHIYLCDNLEIGGAGLSSKLKWTGANNSEGIFRWDNATVSISNVRITNLYLDGDGKAAPIWLCNVDGLEIDHCYVTNPYKLKGTVYTSGKNTGCGNPMNNTRIHDNIVYTDPIAYPEGRGQLFYTTTWANNTQIYNNIGINPYELCLAVGSGSDIYSIVNTQVHHNIFIKYGGIGGGVHIHGNTHDTQFQTNIVDVKKGYGIQAYKDPTQTKYPVDVFIDYNDITHYDTAGNTSAIYIQEVSPTEGFLSITHNNIECDFNNGKYGIYWQIAFRFDISHNHVRYTDDNAYYCTASTCGSGILHANEAWYSGGRGYKLVGLANSTITDNIAANCTSDGFQFDGCLHDTINDNESHNNGGWGYTSGGGSNYNTFVSNIAFDNASGSYNWASFGADTIYGLNNPGGNITIPGNITASGLNSSTAKITTINATTVAASETLTVGGNRTHRSGDTRSIWFPATVFTAVENSPSAGTQDNMPTYDMSNATQEQIGTSWCLPDDWDDSTDMSAYVYWCATATAGGVDWAIYYNSVVDSADPGAGVAGAYVDDTADGTSLDLSITPVFTMAAGSIGSNGEMGRICLRRRVAEAEDTMQGDAKVFGILVIYTTK